MEGANRSTESYGRCFCDFMGNYVLYSKEEDLLIRNRTKHHANLHASSHSERCDYVCRGL